MKKTRSKILAVVMILCMVFYTSSSAFAAETDPENPNMTVTDSIEIIPVYGYLGTDTAVIDPEVTEIYVEVPVKIMFAAFEGDDGMITSPIFTITNLSEISDVKVEIEQFVQRPDPAANLDGNLSLKLVSYTGDDIIANLFPSEYPPSKVLTDNLPKYVEGSDGNKINFRVGGTWGGSLNGKLQPVFDMTIKFSAAE